MKTTMWSATVRELSFQEQLDVTAKARFDEFVMTPQQVLLLKESGMSSREMLQRAADTGVQLTHLDPLARWSREWVPQNLPVETHDFFAVPTDEFLGLAAELEMTSLTAMSTGRIGSLSIPQMIDEFAAVCMQAAKFEIRVDLEFIPLDWNVSDISTAWQILSGAGQPNSGMVFDFWHFMRSGADWETLAIIPGEQITRVQVADATLKIPAHRTAIQDCLEDRVPLGMGEFDIERLLTTLHDMGALTSAGPEYFSNRMDHLTGEDNALVCRASMVDAFDALNIPHNLGPKAEWREVWNATTAEPTGADASSRRRGSHI